MCERVSDVQCTMNCEKNESFSRLRCATAFRFSGLSTGIKDKISLSAPSSVHLGVTVALFFAGRLAGSVVRRGAAVGVRRDGAGRVDGFGRRRCSRRRQSRRFSLRVRARSVILRRDTMKSSLLGLLLLTTSSRAILPVSVTLVEEQG